MKLPRFTLRELFLLVVIAAMGCGWWVERQRAASLQTEVSRLKVLAQQETFTKRHLVPFAVGNPATLIQMVKSATGPEEWSDRGGTASTSLVLDNQSLIVAGDGRIQVRVAEYLGKLERFDKKAKEYGQSWMDYEKLMAKP